jgi:exopolysaccharide biosynthesis WecB/TagA/CpsF family protein
MSTVNSTDPSRDAPVPSARLRLLNIWVDDLPLPELLARLVGGGGSVFTLNLDHLWHLQRNADFHAAYRAADYVTADSSYVMLALRLLRRRCREKITGSSLVPRYCDHAAAYPGEKVFFLGAAPGVAQLALQRTNERVGRELVVGALSPSMDFVNDEQEIDEAIRVVNASGATALIVGLGAPKQEVWIHRHRVRMPGVRVFMGVGATIDYEAGVVKRAPAWMGRIGVEWLHRVVTQPRRYLARYVRNLVFFRLLLAEMAGVYRDPLLEPRGRPPL